MALNTALFAALAPEFAGYNPTALALVAAEAERFVNVDVWKTKTDLGVVYMTAHMLKMASLASSNASGQVTMEKVGDLQRSYSTGSGSSPDDELGQTKYGQEFLRARRTLQISPFVVS